MFVRSAAEKKCATATWSFKTKVFRMAVSAALAARRGLRGILLSTMKTRMLLTGTGTMLTNLNASKGFLLKALFHALKSELK